MTTLEPGQRDAGRTRKRWFFLALAVGGTLAVLVVGRLFGVLESAPTVVQPTVHTPSHPTAGAPAASAPPLVRAPAAPTAVGKPRQVTTQGPNGSTTTVTVSSDGTVTNSTTTTAAPN
jgi:hypothetical protein